MGYLVLPRNMLLAAASLALTTGTCLAEQVSQVPVSPKPVELTQLKIKRTAETPVTVFADDQHLQQVIRQSSNKKAEKTKREKTPQKDESWVIHLEQPVVAHKMINTGPNFVFQDITERTDDPQLKSNSVLSMQARIQQVEALRQSAGAGK